MAKIVDTFCNRLNYAIAIKNIRPTDLVNKTGISKSNISHYRAGRYEPKQDGVKAIAEALEVDPVWLMGFDVPMVQNSVVSTTETIIKVPIIGKIAAGQPILAVENIIGYAEAPSSFIKSGQDYFYLIVQGDSMNLKFHEGDYILVQKQDTLENDEIGVILIDDEATVKKFKEENGVVILTPMSTNPAHSVKTYNPEKVNIKIIGKVISYQGKI